MKKKFYGALVLAGLAIIAATLFSLIKSSHQMLAGQAKALKDLIGKIGQLEQSSASLEKQLSEIKNRTQITVIVPAQVFPPPATLTNPKTKTPPGTPFEFNGRTYYLTPLAETPQISLNERKWFSGSQSENRACNFFGFP